MIDFNYLRDRLQRLLNWAVDKWRFFAQKVGNYAGKK